MFQKKPNLQETKAEPPNIRRDLSNQNKKEIYSQKYNMKNYNLNNKNTNKSKNFNHNLNSPKIFNRSNKK